jgi:ABC-type nitrate/sulfonate/bicarbonate transport system substrate-binding protein
MWAAGELRSQKSLDNHDSVVRGVPAADFRGGRMSRRLPSFAALWALGPSAIRVALLLLALPGSPSAAADADRLVLQLHRPAQFEFAGYYAALWQGFYREAGLDVEIKPGTAAGISPIDPVHEMVEGRAQFGTGTVQLLVRAAQGQSLLLLAPIFQQSDARVYFRSDGDFSSPAVLLNGKVGRLPPSNVLDLELRTALQAEAIDPDKLRSLSVEPGQALADLAHRRVDAVVGSAWELPWQAREQGIAIKAFDPAGYRIAYYGDSLFTLQRLAEIRPVTARHFREASIKGWAYALQHPDEVAARILAELPSAPAVSDPAGFVRYQTEIARQLARYPDVPLGHSNPERWSRIQQSFLAVGEVSRPADLAAFLYDPDATPANRVNWQAAAATAIAVSIAMLASAGFLWRWREGRGAPFLDQLRQYLRVQLSRLRLPAAAWPRLLDRLRMFGRRLRAWPRFAELAAAIANRLEAVWTSARPVAGGRRPGSHSTDLNAMLRTVERSIRRRLPASVECRLSLLPEPWLCHSDPDAVAGATLDLVAGAAADMPAGGDLIVGTRQYAIDDAAAAELAGSTPGEYVRLTVKDNGPGLSPERLDRILDPAATVRSDIAAAGELARRLGGFARVESAEGIGTAVHLYFRRAVLAEVGAHRPPEDDERPEAAAA